MRKKALPSDELRLLVLCAEDPEGERAFSGSARSLFRALEQRGCVHHKANVLGFTDPFARGGPLMRLLRRLDRLGIEARYRWSDLSFARNSRRARTVAFTHRGYNACLMYGTTFNPRLKAPTYCYFDTTAAQVYRARAWEFSEFSHGHAQRIIAYQRGVFHDCTGIFPRTQWAAESAIGDYGVPPDKVCVAHAGPNHEAAPLPHGPYDGKTILFIGSEFERKGGPLILEAFRLLRSRIPDARLVIAGCSPGLEEPGVEVAGAISKDAPGGLERILTLYSEASLFCIMSRFEPFGIVVVEAQHGYVPCVVPARFAFPETVVDGATGRLVPEYDAGLLADAFAGLLADPARLEAMGKAAHDHARAHFTWQEAARRIHERMRSDLAAQAS